MNRPVAILWKEYREHRWLFVAAVTVFLLATVGSGLGNLIFGGSFKSEDPVAPVLGLGWLLAVLLAVGGTSRDLGAAREFWLSRPIRPELLLIAKYVVGLSVLLIATCGSPLLQKYSYGLLQHYSHGEFGLNRWEASVMQIHSFTLVEVYSIAFLLGCIISQASKAAMLGIFAALLVYFMPMLVDALKPLSILDLLQFRGAYIPWEIWSCEGPRAIALVAATVAVSAGCLALSLVAVRRSWRIEADKSVLTWSLALLVLILWGAAAMKIGVNMSVERRIKLATPPHSDPITKAWLRNGNGFAPITSWTRKDANTWVSVSGLCRLTASTRDASLSPPVPLDAMDLYAMDVAWSDESPRRAHLLAWVIDGSDTPRKSFTCLKLHTILFDANDNGREISQVDLLQHLHPQPNDNGDNVVALHLRKGRLYVVAHQSLAVMSLHDPNAPAIEQVIEPTGLWLDYDCDRLRLLPLPGVPLEERVDISASLAAGGWGYSYDNGVLVCGDAGATFKLKRVEGNTARFEQVGARLASPLEGLTERYCNCRSIHDGLLYVTSCCGRGMSEVMNVFDIRDPARPRRVAHYAETVFAPPVPLDNGRVGVLTWHGGMFLDVLSFPRNVQVMSDAEQPPVRESATR